MDSDYTILLDRENLKGVAGNRLTESGASLAFRAPPSDTLGFMEGMIEDGTGDSSSLYRLIFKQIDSDLFEEIEITGQGEWSSKPVLPGRYTCLAHRDDDGDSSIFRGIVNPYSEAEQVVAYPDTVTVEPRWPTKNINFIFR